MRRKDKVGTIDDAWNLLHRASVVHLATGGDDPQIRVLHPIVSERRIFFHSAPKGEKLGMVGQAAVMSVHESIAQIPSTFTHPERACPATTWYRSAQFRGRLQLVVDAHQKAHALNHLMARFQPEGGYRPLSADDAFYAASLKGIAILELCCDQVVSKHAPGSKTRSSQRLRLAEQLWERGDSGDVAAMEWVLREDRPAFLTGPDGIHFVVAPGESHLQGAVALLEHQYWNQGVSRERIADAHRHSDAWIVAKQGDELVATGRAISDGSRVSYVADVAVVDRLQGSGVGTTLMKLLADHPQIRRTNVILRTRTAGPFYAALGYELGGGAETWGLRR